MTNFDITSYCCPVVYNTLSWMLWTVTNFTEKAATSTHRLGCRDSEFCRNVCHKTYNYVLLLSEPWDPWKWFDKYKYLALYWTDYNRKLKSWLILSSSTPKLILKSLGPIFECKLNMLVKLHFRHPFFRCMILPLGKRFQAFQKTYILRNAQTRLHNRTAFPEQRNLSSSSLPKCQNS